MGIEPLAKKFYPRAGQSLATQVSISLSRRSSSMYIPTSRRLHSRFSARWARQFQSVENQQIHNLRNAARRPRAATPRHQRRFLAHEGCLLTRRADICSCRSTVSRLARVLMPHDPTLTVTYDGKILPARLRALDELNCTTFMPSHGVTLV